MTNQYIYVVRGHDSTYTNRYKVGKTINLRSTKSAYSRLTTVSMIHYQCNDIDEAEKIILNLVSPYRVKRTKTVISEEVDMDLETLKFVIMYVCDSINYKNLKIDNLSLSRSTNTMESYRNKIPADFIHDICENMSIEFNKKVQMDTSGYYDQSLQHTLSVFDRFISVQN